MVTGINVKFFGAKEIMSWILFSLSLMMADDHFTQGDQLF